MAFASSIKQLLHFLWKSGMCSVVASVSEIMETLSFQSSSNSITIKTIKKAARRIEKFTKRTPIIQCKEIDRILGNGNRLFFKCELFQETGSFKARGACNAVQILSKDNPHVVTHSSGNHGHALAWAAVKCNIKAHIAISEDVPDIKVANVKKLGANIVRCKSSYSSRVLAADALCKKFDAVLVHSSNDPLIINGQGTVGLELVEQMRRLCSGVDPDVVVVPVGGGGLLAGVAVAVKSLCPKAKVIGAEPALADDAARSKASNSLITHDALPNTIADGLRTVLGSYTWPIIRDEVDCIVTVTEEEIVESMKMVHSRMNLVVEPSAAVAVAAVMTEQFRKLGCVGTVGIVLSGGNIDPTEFEKLIA